MHTRRPAGIGIARARLLAAAAWGALLLAGSAGCLTEKKDLGFERTHLQGSRVETSSGPAVGWPVTILIDGREVGTWPTDAKGDVAVNLRHYVPKLSRQGLLRLEYRIRTPEGQVETRKFEVTPDMLVAAGTGAR